MGVGEIEMAETPSVAEGSAREGGGILPQKRLIFPKKHKGTLMRRVFF
jgi:hypothetical protein